MSKQVKYVKIICIVLVFSVLALSLAVGFLAVNILRNSQEPNPLDGFEEKQETQTPKPNNPNNLFPYQVRSEKSVDAVYLRATCYGNYNGMTWLDAVPYPELIDGKYPATYLGTKQIEKWSLSEPIALEIVPNNSTKVIPTYTATTLLGSSYDEEYDIPIDDVTANNVGSEYYRMYYYNYDDISLKSSVAILEYEQYEDRYKKFVEEHYLNIDRETKDYMLEIAKEQSFNKYANNLPEKIAEYVMNIGVYSMAYNTQLDQEDNVAIAFIENYKEGTCKHFATVATLLFRALNVPARYVVGYMTETTAGEWVQLTADDAHAWVEFYVDGFGWKMLEVTPQRLDTDFKVKPVDVDKLFDGTPLIPEAKIEGLEEYEEKGYTYKAVISGEQTEPGISESKIESLTIYDSMGNDVTSRFNLEFETGEIKVYMGVISLQSDDFTYVYNGMPPLSNVEKCEVVVIEGSPFGEDYQIEIIQKELSVSIGEHPHLFDISIVNGEGEDITELYKRVYEFGSVNVVANILTLEAGTASKIYDKTPLTCDELKITQGTLVDGDYISEYKIIGEQIMPGTSANTIDLSSVVILNSLGEDVTDKYVLTAKDGTLTVYFEE